MIDRKLATHIARQFHVHLRAELAKNPAMIDSVRFDGRTPREIDGELLSILLEEIPELAAGPTAENTLFPLWTEWNNFYVGYEDFSFEAYNIIFLYRILDLFRGDEASARVFHDKTIEVFEKFDTSHEIFSVSFFIRVENNMRELLRRMLSDIPDIDRDRAWDLIFDQSKAYQETVNEFFENLLRAEKTRSDDLLNNILPESIADELKEHGSVAPKKISRASVLFTDFAGFTAISGKIPPETLIRRLDGCFSLFDRIISHYGLEKIKTIGDAYMAAGGVPEVRDHHEARTALATLGMRHYFEALRQRHAARGEEFWDIRIGFHTGPVIAGIIGRSKFSYDIWGDTVNTASRMESAAENGGINISASAAEVLEPWFLLEYRGERPVKGKGEVAMYKLMGLKREYAKDAAGVFPNRRLKALLNL